MKKLRDGPTGGQGEAEGAAEVPAQVHGWAEAGTAGHPPVDAVRWPAHGHRRGGKLWDTALPDMVLKGAVTRMPDLCICSVHLKLRRLNKSITRKKKPQHC